MLRYLRQLGLDPREYRGDVMGLNSVLGPATPEHEPPFEVRLRVVCRLDDAAETEVFVQACQDFWFMAPNGAGGVRAHARPVLQMLAASAPQTEVPIDLSFLRIGEPVHAAR